MFQRSKLSLQDYPNFSDDCGNDIMPRYVMGIGEAEVFSERLKRELHALEAANVHAILESEHLVDEVKRVYYTEYYITFRNNQAYYWWDWFYPFPVGLVLSLIISLAVTHPE